MHFVSAEKVLSAWEAEKVPVDHVQETEISDSGEPEVFITDLAGATVGDMQQMARGLPDFPSQVLAD